MFNDIADIEAPKMIETRSFLIQGQVSSGKSFLAASAACEKRPLIYFSFDKPMSGLHLHPCREFIKFIDFFDPPPRQGAAPKPSAWNDFSLYLGMLEYKRGRGELSTDYWYVLDSLRFAELAALNQALYEMPTARKTIKAGGTEVYVPNGWDGYKASTVYLNAAIQRIKALGNIIAIGHERPEEDPASSSKEKRDRMTGKYILDPPRINDVKSCFTDKYRVDSAGVGAWRLFTQTNADFEGGCTITGAATSLNASLSELFTKELS